MKKILPLLCIAALCVWACKDGPKGSYTTEVSTPDFVCFPPNDWFTMVNGYRKTPAPDEGATSAFADNATVTNCDFHQWSWQKFLWLTNTMDNGRPLFLDSLHQVDPVNGQLVHSDAGIMLTEISQASGASDILKANPAYGNASSTDTVYYSVHVNNSFYKTMVTYGPVASKTPDSVANVSFPVGALETKISWINTEALADTTNYFITDGVIHDKKVRIALLGMHVVGIVENHPEFVWATFEHDKMAPMYDWSKATHTTDAAVTSTENYLFFNKDASSTVKNISPSNGINTNIFSVYTYGTPVEKNANEQLVFMETSQGGSKNVANISEMNIYVKKKLTDVWANYFYNGSIWINTEGYASHTDQTHLIDTLGYNLSSSKPGDLTRGSVACYNTTMETYVQVGFSPSSIHGMEVGNIVNCFTCHNAKSSNSVSPLLISHVFDGYVKNLQGESKKAIKKEHVERAFKQYMLKIAE